MFLRRHDRADRRYCGSKCRMRALRERRGMSARRPRGRPGRHPIPTTLSKASLRRRLSSAQTRAELAERAISDLQQRFDEQAHELAEARARIAELERLLAAMQGGQSVGLDGTPPSSTDEDGKVRPSGTSGEAGGANPRPQPATPRPGIMEVRRQLSQAQSANTELRALVEELQRYLATLERRCAELEQQLQRALSLAEGFEPSASSQHGDADADTRVQERAAILTKELEQVRHERTEAAEQRDRLLARLTSLTMHTAGMATAPASDYSAGRTELFVQILAELEERDRFAQWEGTHRPRETDRRLDPARTLDEQALVATLTVRWQLMDHAPYSCRQRPRWIVEGVLLDPASEKFLIRQSRERVAYRQRIMAAAAFSVT